MTLPCIHVTYSRRRETMRSRLLALLPAMLLLRMGLADESPSEVVVLTTENFEHLTQASTGATTGDWFLDFYAPWCGHCKHLEPVWEECAQELKGQVNFAKIDVPMHPSIATRFDIRYFPSLKFLHQGSVYDYDGKRDAESIQAFALEGYKEAKGSPVPPPPTLVESFKKQAHEVVFGVKAVYRELAAEVTRVAKGEKPADPQLIIVVGGILLVFVLSALAFVAVVSSGPPGLKRPEKDD